MIIEIDGKFGGIPPRRVQVNFVTVGYQTMCQGGNVGLTATPFREHTFIAKGNVHKFIPTGTDNSFSLA